MLALLLAAALAAAETSPTAVEIASLRSLGAIDVWPDGTRLAYTLTTPKFDPAAKAKDDDDPRAGCRNRRSCSSSGSPGTPPAR